MTETEKLINIIENNMTCGGAVLCMDKHKAERLTKHLTAQQKKFEDFKSERKKGWKSIKNSVDEVLQENTAYEKLVEKVKINIEEAKQYIEYESAISMSLNECLQLIEEFEEENK